MSYWKRPAPQDLWSAIDIYLANAYDAAPPRAVRLRLDTLRATPADDLFGCAVFECAQDSGDVNRYSLRLGNRHYPHMKMIVERAPAGPHHLFRVDTHDRHVRPPAGSPEERAFATLMADNQAHAERIEGAWEQAGLPTFKTYLRDDLARRSDPARHGT